MRYISAIIWALLISGVISYVLSSMGGEAFNLTGTLILAGLFFVAVVILGDVVLKEEKSNQ